MAEWEWTDPDEDHGGAEHWIDEAGEWNTNAAYRGLDEPEQGRSDIAYVEWLAAEASRLRAENESLRGSLEEWKLDFASLKAELAAAREAR